MNIDPDEMKEMRSIITSSEKSARKSVRDRKAYLKKLEAKGESTKEYKIKLRLKAIYELLEQGKTQREICAELNISKSTFYTDKNLWNSIHMSSYVKLFRIMMKLIKIC